MMKMAGGTFASRVDYEQFLAQARDFEKNYDEKALDRFWADVITSGLSHPFPVWRVSEILEVGRERRVQSADEARRKARRRKDVLRWLAKKININMLRRDLRGKGKGKNG